MARLRIARSKLANFVAGVAVLVAMILAAVWFYFPFYKEVMYKPAPRDRTSAVKALQGVIGDDAQKATVPAVNNDFGMIYVTVPLSPMAVEKVRAAGQLVAGMPGEVYDVSLSRSNRTVMIDLKSSPNKIMIGASGDSRNGEICALNYRGWLEGKKLPWP